MGPKAVEQELQRQTEALPDIWGIENITTERIADEVGLSRNTVSQYLNELLKAKKVIQVKSRPTNFVDREMFELHFFAAKEDVYGSIDDLVLEETQQNNVFQSFIGHKSSMKEGIDQIITAVNYPSNGLPFILAGKTGVGKSYLAKLSYEYCIQEQILAEDAPFITLNCAQYYHNPELLSSNLFGYSKGSFTGADADTKGVIEAADNGILFLDECHRLDPESQEKLFSFMDNGTYQRMGETGTVRHANVRLIFATTENLSETFLQTFMRRIPISVKIPDLNDRSKTELKAHIFKAFLDEATRLKLSIEVNPWIINRLFNRKYDSNVGELKTDIRILCARVYSRADKNDQSIMVNSDTIGNDLLTKLLAINEQEIIIDSPIIFERGKNLTDYLTQFSDDNLSISLLVQKLIKLETSYQNEQVTIDVLKQQLMRESSTLMDEIVLRDNKFENESLKYMTNVIQQLFDYLNSSFFVKINGNVVIAIADFIYRKNDFEVELTPVNANKINRLLEVMGDQANAENQMLSSLLDLIKTKFDFKMSALHKLILLSYLTSLDLDDKQTGRHAVILAHGFSTASSIAAVANQFLNQKIFDAYDMPLTVSTDQVKGFLADYISKYDCHDGLIVLVDMGSLMVVPELLEEEIGGPLLVINNVSTQEALQVGEMIQKGTLIDEIGRRTQDRIAVEFKLKYPKITKQPMIITSCHTGLGTARQLKKLLESSLPADSGYQFESVDYDFLKKIGKQSSLFNQFDVVAIVGTADPKIEEVPFISLEKIVSTEGTEIVEQLFPTITDAKTIATINDKMIQNLSLERLISAVTILDVHKVIENVGEMIERLQDTDRISISNSQRATLYVHISSLIERLIRNDAPLEYAPDNIGDRTKGLAQIARALTNIEDTYSVQVSEGELNYLYDIIFDE